MKTKYLLPLAIFAATVFAGCKYEEAALTPTDKQVIKDENTYFYFFPEGTNKWDNEIGDIYNDYGVKIIYRDWVDINLKEAVEYVNFKTVYSKEVLRNHYDAVEHADTLQRTVDVLNNVLFRFIDKDKFRKINAFPPFIYLVKDYGLHLPEQPGKYFQRIMMDPASLTQMEKARDGWVLSLDKKVLYDTWPDRYRIAMTAYMISALVERGYRKQAIVYPADFAKDVNLGNSPAITFETKDVNDADFYRTRGFPDYLLLSHNIALYHNESTTISGVAVSPDDTELMKMAVQKPGSGNRPATANAYFKRFLVFAMYYQNDAQWARLLATMGTTVADNHVPFVMNDPKNAIIKEKYEYIVKYMLENYGIDLVKIANSVEW